MTVTHHGLRTRRLLDSLSAAAPGFEPLEERILFVASEPTALEQLHIEIINRMRADPAAEAVRLNLGVNGINEGPPKKNGVAVVLPDGERQPLAINPFLMDAAQDYAVALVAAGQLDHFLNGTSPQGRAAAAGYSGGLAGFENLAFVSGNSVTAANVESNYNNLFRDFIPGTNIVVDGRGHRINLLDERLTEIGVGNAAGGGKTFAVQDMAIGPTYLTGVVFSDTITTNNFYTVGEGKGGVTITAVKQGTGQEFSTTTFTAGGYSLALGDGTYTVTASGGPLTEDIVVENIVIDGENEKVDFILGVIPPTPPDLIVEALALSQAGTLVPGDKPKLGVRVTNQTGDATSGQITLKVFASTDGTLDVNGDTLLGTLSVPAFSIGAAGSFKDLSVQLLVATDTLPDDYNLIVSLESNTIAESNEANNTDVGDGVTVAWQAGDVGARKNVKLTYKLAGSNVVNTVTLAGGGTATVTPVSGDAADGVDIDVTGTTSKSALAVTAPANADVLVNDITVAGTIKSITGKAVDLLGDITVVGALFTLLLDDVADDHTITIGPPDVAGQKVAITLGEVADTTINSQMAISKLDVIRWRDLGGGNDLITAPWITNLNAKGDAKNAIAGDFEASLNLSGTGAPKGVSLATAKIIGTLDDATWTIAGNVNALTAGTIAAAFTLNATGLVKAITANLDASGGFIANAIDKFTVKRNLINAGLQLNAAGFDPLNLKKFALGTLVVTGKATDVTVLSSGHVNNATFGAVEDVNLFAGVDAGGNTLPDDAGDLTAVLLINAVTIKGLAAEVFDTVDLIVSADKLGKIAVANVDTDNNGTPFGLAMKSLVSFTRTEGKVKTVWTNKLSPALLTDDDDLTFRFL